MFDNLLLYELILIITGSILFLALVFALIWYVVKNRTLLQLLPFFIIPIAMIAWPTINTISYEDGKIELKKLAEEVEENPADSSKRALLEKALEGLSDKRSQKDVQALIYKAEAQSALGNYEAAEQIINKALIAEPENEDAIQVKEKVIEQKNIQSNFNADISELNINLDKLQNPGYTPSEDDFNKLSGILSEIQVPVYTDEQSLITISKALTTIDEKEASLAITEKVIEASPQSEEAKIVKTEIETGRLKPIKSVEEGEKTSIEIKSFDKIVIQPKRE